MADRPLGVILAGGRATRMGGGDKCLLPLAGRPLLAHILARLAPQVSGLVLNANGDPARFAAFGVEVVADADDDFVGPLAGVLAGMEAAAARGMGRIVTVAGDTPGFPPDLVARLEAAADAAGAPVAIAATPDPERGGAARHPTFGLWSVALRADLRAALAAGTRKVVAFADPHGAATALFDAGGDPFFNINTPADLARAAARTEAGA